MRNIWILLSLLLLSGCDLTLGAGTPDPKAVRPGTNHKVRAGESLFAIAEEAYGSGLEWTRIWEANPWIPAEGYPLRIGETIYIPPRDASWGDPPPRKNYALDPGTGSFEGQDEDPDARTATEITADPGNEGSSQPGGFAVWRNLASNVSSKTLFGHSIEKALLLGFGGFLGHAIFQGILVWLAANITFVKEASLKKSLRAIFLTESLTFATLVVVCGVAILMVYLGTEPAASPGMKLFPTFESYLRSPTGLVIAGFTVLALYVTLSLRFLPQVFAIPMGRAATLMAIAILIPHLTGAYLVGQRMGIIR